MLTVLRAHLDICALAKAHQRSGRTALSEGQLVFIRDGQGAQEGRRFSLVLHAAVRLAHTSERVQDSILRTRYRSKYTDITGRLTIDTTLHQVYPRFLLQDNATVCPNLHPREMNEKQAFGFERTR